MPNQWQTFIEAESQQQYYSELMSFLETEAQAGKVIYPPQDEVFSAFKLTPLSQTKVVIIGQDPYHGPNQAHGLCFSVNKGIKIPPSLVNIYKELATDIEGFTIPEHGDLRPWATQGVMLLNTVLTVEQSKAHAHAGRGWETFTDKALMKLNEQAHQIVFVLWGSHAIKKSKLIDNPVHKILTAPHPSPLSAYRGFFGCRHFSQVNQLLVEAGQKPIDWQV
ncbi:uracil-DNA glycosylase [Parashewanella tropica]|uniref:uracil-DNA glycosylase n=1 Tax=Parashewanella tropica TaxID=2547970 RepID=UPI00105A1945|nr:uracil-DNA glycosylase [Parashewanella tropica]